METKWIVLFIMSVCLACHETGAEDVVVTTNVQPNTTKATSTTTVPTSTISTTRKTTEITKSSTPVPSSTLSVSTTLSTTTPTPMPSTTKPTPPHGVWYTQDEKTQTVCILLSARIILAFNDSTSLSVDGTNGKSDTDSGHCGELNQLLSISVTNSSLVVDFTFSRNDTGSNYHISRITVTNFTSTANLSVTAGFWSKNMKGNMTYHCDAQQIVFKDDKSKDFVTGITLASMKLEAFRNGTNFVFDNPEETCSDDKKVSNLVPIVVGAALGGLILIVLIAYLIGRKRSRRGYEQV